MPTDETRAQVQALCGFGLAEADVADYLDISLGTLRKHYSDRIRKARPALMAMASGGLFAALQKKEPWAVKYLHGTLGKKYGWTERHEVTGANGEKLFAGADPSKLSDKNFALLLDLLTAIGVDVSGGQPAPGR